MGTDKLMSNTNQEEADTRLMLHVVNCMENGAKTVMVRSVDTDVVVILIGMFYHLIDRYPGVSIWVAFGTGRSFKHFHINTACTTLGRNKCEAMLTFHAFTGCDTCSSFHGRKKTACSTWASYTDVTSCFQTIAKQPFVNPDIGILERFVVLLYDKTSSIESVNNARQELFSKKNRNLENIPPYTSKT